VYAQRRIVFLENIVSIFIWFQLIRDLFSNQLSGTIPPQLGNLTKLTELYDQHRIIHLDDFLYLLNRFRSWSLCNFIASMSLSLSLRYLDFNQLTGTIPPQLANLTQLTILYAHNRIVHL